MKIILQFLFFSIIFIYAHCEYTIASFEGLPFKVKPPSGMYELGGLNLDGETSGMNIACYGDFNNDKYTDIVLLSDDQKSLTIYLYSHRSYGFSSFDTIQNDKAIESVIPADYNYDGLLDLLVISKDGDQMELKFYFGHHSSEPPFFSISLKTIIGGFDKNMDYFE